MPARHSSDLSRLLSEHPELAGRYVYFCPTREISVAARFTASGELELLYDASTHEYSRPILESLRNRLLHGDGGATANIAALVQTLGDTEGSADKLINLLYTNPHCRGKCVAHIWKMLKTPNPLKTEEMKLSKEDFLAMFCLENDQSQPVDIQAVMEPVQLREESPPPAGDCPGIPIDPYKDYERMSTEMKVFRIPPYVKKRAGFYRHTGCTGQSTESGALCTLCAQVQKTIDGLKQKTSERFCNGVQKAPWIEDLRKIRPIADLADHGDRFRHARCKKRKEGRSFAAERCKFCQLLKQRLVARKNSRKPQKDLGSDLNWLLHTSPKFLSGPELELREKLVNERKEKLQREKEAKRRNRLGLNVDVGVRQRKLHTLKKPMRPKYVRMTMQLTNPQCEWGDCQERFATVKDLTRHVHLIHMPTIAAEIGTADDGANEDAQQFRCRWRGCHFSDSKPWSFRQHLYMAGHMGNGRLMQFESNWYANRYKILCKWKDCPMAEQPFANLKAMYDHLEETHFHSELPANLKCKWGICHEESNFEDAEQLRLHVDRHFGGALRALWEPAESLKEVRRALAVLLQTSPNLENPAAEDDEPTPPPADEEEEDFDGWCLEWELGNKQQQQPPIKKEPKRGIRNESEKVSLPSAEQLPEQILEITEPTRAATVESVAQPTGTAANAEATTGIRRSSRPKKPTVRFEESEKIVEAENENENGTEDAEDETPPAKKRSRRRGLQALANQMQQHTNDQQPSAVVVMEILTEQKQREMRRMMLQHVLYVPEVTEFDFDTYYLLWEYFDSLMGIGFRKRQRAAALQNAAAKGQPAPVFRVPENDEDRFAVTWDRLRNQKVRQRIHKVTQRPPSFSSFLKSTSISLYRARLMLAHSICFWGDCREKFQTIRQLADHAAAVHLKPLFEGEVSNIPCGWRRCKMVFKGVRTLLIHMAEMHIGNEDLMNFQESGCTPPVPAECTCFWAGCGLTFTNYSAFHEHVCNQHIKVLHGTMKSPGEKLRCRWADCTQEVTTQMNLSSHMQHLHIGDDWLSKLCEPPTPQEMLDTRKFHFNRPIPLEVTDPDWYHDQFWLQKGRNAPGFPHANGRVTVEGQKAPAHSMGLPMKTSDECIARDAQLLMNPQCNWAGCTRPRFQKVKDLIDHVENSHLKPMEQQAKKKPQDFVCRWAGCKKQVRNLHAMRLHMRLHWGSSALIRLQEEGLHFAPNCYWGACRAQFNSLEELIAHVDRRHLDPLKEYDFPSGLQCKWLQCGRAVNGVRGLEIHVKSMHTGTAWAVKMLNLLQGTSAIETPTQAMNPIWRHGKKSQKGGAGPRQRPEPVAEEQEVIFRPKPAREKKVKKRKQKKPAPPRAGSGKRKAPLNVSSSSSSGGSSSESEEDEESPQWEVDHSFEAPAPALKRRRVQQPLPKVRVQPASAQYEDYGQYLQQQPQQGDMYEQQDTDDDLEVFYVPVRLPKGSRVSVPEGAFGRVDVEDQGGSRRRTMMLVEAAQQMQQQAAAHSSAAYQHQAAAGHVQLQQQQRQMGGQQIRLSVVRASGASAGVQLQYQRGQMQIQQQMAQPYQYHIQSPIRERAEAISGIGAYYEI